MMPHGKVYETPVVHAECLLLPKEPFPGTPPLPMVGEVMLQEVRARKRVTHTSAAAWVTHMGDAC